MSDAKEGSEPDLPSASSYFLETPLYGPIAVGGGEVEWLIRLEYFQETLDSYCRLCGTHSVFQGKALSEFPLIGAGSRRNAAPSANHILKSAYVHVPMGGSFIEMETAKWALRSRSFQNFFTCTRCKRHHLHFFSRVAEGAVEKVGQTPSLADLHQPDLGPYRAALGDKYAELVRAVGLSAHGIGIGAFVYLRRVFEHLVEEAHGSAVADSGWDEDLFVRSRMAERIELLRHHLPSFLVEHSRLYSILSKGVHELQEDECIKYFPVVLEGTKLILEERLAEIRKRDRIASISRELGSLGSK